MFNDFIICFFLNLAFLITSQIILLILWALMGTLGWANEKYFIPFAFFVLVMLIFRFLIMIDFVIGFVFFCFISIGNAVGIFCGASLSYFIKRWISPEGKEFTMKEELEFLLFDVSSYWKNRNQRKQ